MRSANFAILLTVVAFIEGCSEVGGAADAALNDTPPTTTVALYDRSISVPAEDRSLYVSSLKALGVGMRGGDRLLLAPIGDQTRSNFRPSLDLPVISTDVRLDQEDAEAEARKTIESLAESLLAAGNDAGHTRILEAIGAASEAFKAGQPGRRRLILLTDGVEESDVVNLDQPEVTSDEIKDAMAKAKTLDLLPNLRGVDLIVIGAGGEDYAGVRAFWIAYAKETGAKLIGYGRLPLQPAA